MNISANETYWKSYSCPFRRFHRFPFYSPFCLWLIPQPNKIFCVFMFQIKVNAFQKWAIITFSLSFTSSPSPLEVISADTYIFVAKDVKYSLLCPLMRASNYFLCSKPPRGIIKKSYDVKCNYFTLTLPCICTFSYWGGWWVY